MKQNLTFRRSVAGSLIALVVSFGLAACGGSGTSGSGGASAGSGAASGGSDALKYADCMRSHGIPDYPDPNPNSAAAKASPGEMYKDGQVSVDGQDLSESEQAVTTASKKCQQYSPDSQYGPRYSAAQLAQIQAGALAMAKCMRAHGITNYPDTKIVRGPGGYGFSSAFPSANFDYKSPAFIAANRTCSRILSNAIPGKKG